MQHKNHIVPIEVKAGSTGALRSLHQFMHRKNSHFAVRVNSGNPTFGPIRVKIAEGTTVEYHLLSIPLYLLGQLHRLIENCIYTQTK